jgi:TolB-like protein/DNA-binding winged helix-turn-helix (wHTH) protein
MSLSKRQLEQVIFCFDNFRLDAESLTLRRNNKEIHLAKRPFQVLLFLLENRERIVSREELLDKFWDGHDVYDDALRKTIGAIRKALDDTKKPSRFIETRYGSGFRFVGKLEENSQKERKGNAETKAVGSWQLAERRNGNEQKTNSTEQTTNDKEQNRYVLISISIISILFFFSLSFYVYSPNNKDQPPNNLVEAATPVRSIAVLPLKNLTGEVNNEYFSDGVTESIITQLSRVSELRIVSSSSTFALKDKEIDPREIGKKLNVDALLEGSVQKKGDLLSVNVRLISTNDGRVLWTSQDFERSVENAYELQDTISCNIAIELRTELCEKVPGQNTSNADAYQAYLKGRFQWNKRTAEGIKKSIEFYDQAIALDPKFARAYAGLAESYVQGIWHVPFNSKEVLPKAEQSALKAIELDYTLAEAHTALANVYELQWNWSEAEREIKRAIELNPRYARAYHVQAFCFLIERRNDEANAAIERARELDPLNLVINTDKATIFFQTNRNDEAFQQWEKTLELDPNFALAYEHRATAYQVLGNESAAIADSTKAMELNGQSAEKIAAYRQTATRYGLKAIYRNELEDLLAKEKRGENVSFISFAWSYASLGQKQEAFKYIEKAYSERSAEMVLVLTSRKFAPLYSDPRFAELLKRI